jgi:hypothetical protein
LLCRLLSLPRFDHEHAETDEAVAEEDGNREDENHQQDRELLADLVVFSQGESEVCVYV